MELEIDELKTLTFSKKVDLPKGINKLELNELVFNKSPMFVCSPNKDSFKLSPLLVEKFQINMEKCLKNLLYIQNNIKKIEAKVQSMYKNEGERGPSNDVDQSLYDGFISNSDRTKCNQIQTLSVAEIEHFKPNFEDKKLTKLFLNFKARNYPQLLNELEQEQRRQRELAEAQRQQESRDRERQRQIEAANAAAAELASSEFEMVQSGMAIIQQAVQSVWSRPPSARNGMRAILQIRMLPTGELIDAVITESSGDPAFDRSAENAVYSAAPFRELQALPSNVFNENFRSLSLIFQPEDLLN